MGYSEFKGKTVEEALTNASIELGVASTELDYEVIDKGSSGFLGIGAKQAVIKAKKKEDNNEKAARLDNAAANNAAKKDNKEKKDNKKEADNVKDDITEEISDKQTEKVVENKDEIIKNTYRTLLSRGMKGCYIYCTDPGMREYIRKRLSVVPKGESSVALTKYVSDPHVCKK